MWQKLYFKCSVAPAGVTSRISAIYELNGELNVLIKESEGGPTDDEGTNIIESLIKTSFIVPVPVNYFVIRKQHTMLRYHFSSPRVITPNKDDPDYTEYMQVFSADEFHRKMAQGRIVQLEAKPLIDLQTLLTDRPEQEIEIPANLLLNMGIDEGIGTKLLRQHPECIRVFAAMVKAGLFTKDNPVRNNHMFAKMIVRNDQLGVSNQDYQDKRKLANVRFGAQPVLMRQGIIDLYTTLVETDSTRCMLSRAIHQTIYHDLFNMSHVNPDDSSIYHRFNEVVRALMPCPQAIIERLFSSPDYVLFAYNKLKTTPDSITCLRYLLENIESPSDLHNFYRDFIRLDETQWLTLETLMLLVDNHHYVKVVGEELSYLFSHQSTSLVAYKPYLARELVAGTILALKQASLMDEKHIKDAANNPGFGSAFLICRTLGLSRVEDSEFINGLLKSPDLCTAMTVVKNIFDDRYHRLYQYEQNDLKGQLLSELKTLIQSADLYDNPFRCDLGYIYHRMFGPGRLDSCVDRLKTKYQSMGSGLSVRYHQ
jgi:hypothetical protein